MTPSPLTLTLTLTQPFEGSPVWLELSEHDPDSQATVAPARGLTGLNLETLRGGQWDPEKYGQMLRDQVFQDPALTAYFREVQAKAGGGGRPLRVSIRIDPSALHLQSLRWELMHQPTHPHRPTEGGPLTASERVWLSRYMVSTDWRPVHQRAKGRLRAVVAIAAPPPEDLATYGLHPVDLDGEVARARATALRVPLTVVGKDQPCTLEAVIAAARGADLLTLVCHGTFQKPSGRPFLFLQDASGRLARTPGEDLAERLAGLRQGPRLVVLATCQSAGTGAQIDPSDARPARRRSSAASSTHG